MDDYETCLKRFNDPLVCGFGLRVVQLAEDLDKCVEKNGPQRCLDECLKSCRGENCDRVCLNAVDMAVARNIARTLAQGAVAAASETDLTVPEAVAVGFRILMEESSDGDCFARLSSMRLLSFVAMDLKKLLGMQDMLLLMAPALAIAYDCVGDEAFRFLNNIAITIGREMSEKIAAALRKGVVEIGRITITFPPAR